MTHNADLSAAFALKTRTKTVVVHRITTTLVRARQGFADRRSANNNRLKLVMAAFTEGDLLYPDGPKPLNPYARTFVLLWLLGALAAIGASYIHL